MGHGPQPDELKKKILRYALPKPPTASTRGQRAAAAGRERFLIGRGLWSCPHIEKNYKRPMRLKAH